MATVVSYNTLKSAVISTLQASLTAWGTTADGSNAMFPSTTEIENAIITADGEICTLIAKTPMHPFQTAFVQNAASATNASNLPSRNGMILSVTGQLGVATATWTDVNVDTLTSSIELTGNNFYTGQPVQLTTAGTLPSPLVISTTYYLIAVAGPTLALSTRVQLATSIYNAKIGTEITLLSTGSGSSTMTSQFGQIHPADSKATIDEMNNAPYLYSIVQGGTCGWYFIEGDKFYTTTPATITYTDYISTSSPQAPDSYFWAVVAGAVSKLVKDGADESIAQYYSQMYQAMLQEIASNAKMVPEITSYKG